MSMLMVVVVSAVVLSIAYVTYGPLLVRLLRLDPNARTPAHQYRDDVDYAPLEPNALLSQHFSAIAAAGPIVGPILAGVMFGWLPALIWILVGCVFIGGVHDITALTASIRHKARSIAEVVREHMSRRAFVLFLSFVWLALVYIIIAFTDVTGRAFVGIVKLENGESVSGAGIASSSLMYLALPILMALAMKYGKLSLNWATIIFLPLVGVSIWAGQQLPFDLAPVLRSIWPDANDETARKAWDILLLGYCCIASVVPMWLLLQPRGHLGGYFLYVALIGGAAGLVIASLTGAETIKYDQLVALPKEPIFPVLFITIACGACSGFHSLIASGTTSKQLRVETDAKLIGYGAMLLEGMVAVISLCCVMRLAPTDPLKSADPNLIYATGIGSFLKVFGIPPQLAVSFALMAFTTFVYDTLDVCTRLGRFIIQELTGWQDAKGKWLGTLLTAGVPVFFVTQTMTNVDGKVAPLWRVFWGLFGASNQLLAALTLLGVTVWLWRTRRETWVWFVTGIPTVWMYVMSTWALGRMIVARWSAPINVPEARLSNAIVLSISVLLVVLATLMLIEAIIALLPRRPAGGETNPLLVPA
ncbi:MAG: carbon starvation CstA family protein [Planctomycetaceae bacterium]|nr:carbon starvation CstA family protein [Planctomycetaceae bacterium]